MTVTSDALKYDHVNTVKLVSFVLFCIQAFGYHKQQEYHLHKYVTAHPVYNFMNQTSYL